MGNISGIVWAVIAFLIFTTTLPNMAASLVSARATTGVATTFQTAIDISQLVLGFAPIGLIMFLLWRKAAGQKG